MEEHRHTSRIVGWVGPLDGLDILEKETNLIPVRAFEPWNILPAA